MHSDSAERGDDTQARKILATLNPAKHFINERYRILVFSNKLIKSSIINIEA